MYVRIAKQEIERKEMWTMATEIMEHIDKKGARHGKYIWVRTNIGTNKS